MFVRFFLRNRSAFFLTAILGLTLASAFLAPGRGVRLGLGIASVLAIGTGGYLLSAGRRWHTLFGITAVLGLALQAAGHLNASPLAVKIAGDCVLFVIFGLCLSVVLKHAIFTPDAPPVDRIMGSICGYFLLALIGANLFSLIHVLNPGAFHLPRPDDTFDGRTSVYYSLVTLSTQGYGEIVPRSPVARIAAGLLGAFGTIYLAVIVGAMVSSLASIQRSPDHD